MSDPAPSAQEQERCAASQKVLKYSIGPVEIDEEQGTMTLNPGVYTFTKTVTFRLTESSIIADMEYVPLGHGQGNATADNSVASLVATVVESVEQFAERLSVLTEHEPSNFNTRTPPELFMPLLQWWLKGSPVAAAPETIREQIETLQRFDLPPRPPETAR